MERMIAFCGLDCAQCPAFIATKADDLAAKERLLEEWRVQFNRPEMDMSAVTCDGCTSADRHSRYCGICEVRACALPRGIANCAACAEYSCATLDAFIGSIPQARANLEEMRHPA